MRMCWKSSMLSPKIALNRWYQQWKIAIKLCVWCKPCSIETLNPRPVNIQVEYCYLLWLSCRCMNFYRGQGWFLISGLFTWNAFQEFEGAEPFVLPSHLQLLPRFYFRKSQLMHVVVFLNGIFCVSRPVQSHPSSFN